MPGYFERRSKFIALALLWIVPGAIFFAAFAYHWDRVWIAAGVFTHTPPFVDLRSVSAAVHTLHHGVDPLVCNPNDLLQRPFNYPRLWIYLFSFLNINEQKVWFVALLFCVLYLSCISKLVLECEAGWERLTLLAAGLSVASLFAFERGNNDLLVFAIVFFGCLLSRSSQRSGMFLAATLLKLFPLVALLAEGLRQRGKERVWVAAAVMFAILALGLQWHDLVLIQRATPASLAASYGMLSVRETFWYGLTHAGISGGNVATIAFTAALTCWIAALVVGLHVWTKSNPIERRLLDSRESGWFFIFGTIYVSTFAVGSNWGYRLIFLIPTLPFAFERMRQRHERRWSIAYVLLVLFAENTVAFDWGYKLALSQALTTLLFLMVLAVLVEQAKNYLVPDEKPAIAVEAELRKA